MELPTISLSIEEAEEKYQEYLAASKASGSAEDKLLKSLYYELKQGHPVVKLSEAFKATGLNEDGYPRLAIAKANQHRVEVTFRPRKSWEVDCEFYSALRGANSERISVPKHTFPRWNGAFRREVETVVPIVPPHLRPNADLGRYYVLFEVEAWKPVPNRDPALLKRIGPNLYAVLAVWDLTDVEMLALSVTRGEG